MSASARLRQLGAYADSIRAQEAAANAQATARAEAHEGTLVKGSSGTWVHCACGHSTALHAKWNAKLAWADHERHQVDRDA